MNMTTVPSNQLKAMQHEIAEKAAEIERLCVSVNYKHSKICELSNQLASQELVIQELRDTEVGIFGKFVHNAAQSGQMAKAGNLNS